MISVNLFKKAHFNYSRQSVEDLNLEKKKKKCFYKYCMFKLNCDIFKSHLAGKNSILN